MARNICCPETWNASVTALFQQSGPWRCASSLSGLKRWRDSFAKNRFAAFTSVSLVFWRLKASQSILAFEIANLP
jgi:hypothetical protein